MMYNVGVPGMILLLIVIVLIIVGAALIFRTGWKSGGTVYNDLIDDKVGTERAINIAKERLAKGEITDEEYDRIIQKIKED